MDFVIDDYFRYYTFSCILPVFLLVVSSCYILHLFSLCFRNYNESNIILNDLSRFLHGKGLCSIYTSILYSCRSCDL